MKNIAALILLLCTTGCPPAPGKKDPPHGTHAVSHVTGPSSTYLNVAKKVVIDSRHYIHVLGEFVVDLTWGAQHIAGGAGGKEVYLATFDEEGTCVRLKLIDCTGHAAARGIAVDKNDNIYILVQHDDPCTIDGHDIEHTTEHRYASFVAAFDAEGVYRWSDQWIPGSEALLQDIAVNRDNQLVCVGSVLGPATFTTTDGDPVRTTGSGSAVVATYTDNGKLLWLREYGYASNLSVDTDHNGNILVAGFFGPSLTFGDLTVTLDPVMPASFFAAKLDPAGVPLWLKCNQGREGSAAMDACFDLDGNAYVLGGHDHTVTVEAMTERTRGLYDVFIVKYKPTGDVDGLFTMGSYNDDNGHSICLGVNNQLLVTGDYQNAVWFSRSDLWAPARGGMECFILNLDNQLGINWFDHSDDDGQQIGFGIAADGDVIAVVGQSTGETRFGTAAYSTSGSTSSFLAITTY